MTCILIAHENRDIRELFAFALSEHNQIIAAENGPQAIELFDRYKPTIVVIHTSMPAISGYAVIEHIRLTDLSVKIIATSGNCLSSYSNKTILQIGADLCLPSPTDLNVLRLTVQSIVESQSTDNNDETSYSVSTHQESANAIPTSTCELTGITTQLKELNG